MAEVVFVGTGEALDPALPNTSLLYRGRQTLLVDCGYSVPHAFWRITRDPDLLDAVYVSHLHADHSFGLPALLLWMREAGRARPLPVISGPGVARWLERLLDLAYPGAYAPEKCYPIEPLELEPGKLVQLGPLYLSCAQSAHGVRNLSLRIDDAGTRVCYSGDGQPTEATRALFSDATVLVHECYVAAHDSKGHARADVLLELAREARVQTLCLLHVSRTEKQRVAETVARHGAGLRVLIPQPGDVLEC
jgi:ribonuclease BN (tRNA processing enzyme)